MDDMIKRELQKTVDDWGNEPERRYLAQIALNQGRITGALEKIALNQKKTLATLEKIAPRLEWFISMHAEHVSGEKVETEKFIVERIPESDLKNLWGLELEEEG